MSAVQEAAANTVFRIANLFEQNCALKHGLPKVGGPDRISDVKPEPPPEPQVSQDLAALLISKLPAATAANNSPSPSGAVAAADAGHSLLRRAAPFLIGGALASAGPMGWILNSYLNQPEITQPAETGVKDGSLLQYLEDGGYHLPGGGWQTK